MASKTEICNMALLSLKAETIVNIDTDKSDEARACKIFYPKVLESIFEEFAWPFAQVQAVLGLYEEDPTSSWGYAYAYPVDAARVVELPTGVSSCVPFLIAHGEQGRLIYTDQENAEVVYTKIVTDTSRFPATFTRALSFKLASEIAAPVCDGDLFKLGESAEGKYRSILNTAKRIAQMERSNRPEKDSAMVTARL